MSTSFPEVGIRDESIKLGQFVKLASLVGTGGEGKELIAEGLVFVNGEPETRRGHALHPGDVVEVRADGQRVGAIVGARPE